ncbi:14-3-3 protein [Mortierella sp. NVP85]|nr:14-3-3 protein [Mortierella sp. NVP85]
MPSLSDEERNLYSVAYKNVMDGRRSSWRSISWVEKTERSKELEAKANLLENYRTRVEQEIGEICIDVLKTLEDQLIENAVGAESKVFFLKMKADHYQYLADFPTGDKRKKAADKALGAYAVASAFARELSAVHPTRLGLVLNYAMFYAEILSSPKDSIRVAKEAVSEARVLEGPTRGSLRDENAGLILSVLRDNLCQWGSETGDLSVPDTVDTLYVHTASAYSAQRNAVGVESKIFFLKMKADYSRYMADFSISDKRKKATDKALEAYAVASAFVRELSTCHPVCLGLALNFSVFYNLNPPKEACHLAK